MSHESVKVACIGAGNLTKGLLYPLFTEHGYDVTIVTLTEHSQRALSDGYSFKQIGSEAKRKEYKDIHVVKIDDLPADGLEDYQLITTAVGNKNIPAVASDLSRKKLHPELRVLLCENDITCFRELKPVTRNLFASVVDRIVFSEDPRNIVAESYFSFEVFQKKHMVLPDFIKQSADFEKSFTKKRYLVNTLHAIIAWYGHMKGYAFINDALRDLSVRSLALSTAEELVNVLRHRFPRAAKGEFHTFAEQAIDRFTHNYLKDPIHRVGRNALSKLGRYERLLEPICYCRKHGLPHDSLLRGASYGLVFHGETEDENPSMQHENIFSYIEESEELA